MFFVLKYKCVNQNHSMTTTITNNQLISVKDQKRITENLKNLRESLERNGTFKVLEALQERGAAWQKRIRLYLKALRRVCRTLSVLGQW